MLRCEVKDEIEFVTIKFFDTLEAVREFGGEDYEAAVVPAKARKLFSHFDERSQHDEIRAERRELRWISSLLSMEGKGAFR